MIQDLENKAKLFLSNKGFTVKRKLGQGSFGLVYKAFDQNNNQDVAIKAILPTKDKNVGEQFQKTIQEFKNCGKPNSIHVVQVKDALVDLNNKLIFIVQEYCSKGSLTNYIKSLVKTENILKQIFIQILEGVIAIHEQNIIHSDLKPDNILVDKNNVVKIADFGEAKQLRLEKGHTHTQGQGWTPLFAAPEVNIQQQISKESDYYSVGAVFCLLCDLSFQDLLEISNRKFPKITNHQYKNLLILAFNMMAFEPKKRDSCLKVLNLLKNLDDHNNAEIKKRVKQQNSFCNKVQLIFLLLCSIIPFIFTGISIYYITQSCFTYLLIAQIVMGVLVTYFCFILFEILFKSFYSLLLWITYVKLVLPFPCDDLYICTSDFDIRLWKQFLNDTNSDLLNSICSQKDPQRRENMQQYFQSKYSQSMSIQFYEGSYGVLPYIYLSGIIILFIWFLFRFLKWICFKCCK